MRLADLPRPLGSVFGIGGITGIRLGDGDVTRVLLEDRVRLLHLFIGEGDSTRVLLVDRVLPLCLDTDSTRVLLEDLVLAGDESARVWLDDRPLVRRALPEGGWSRDSLSVRSRDSARVRLDDRPLVRRDLPEVGCSRDSLSARPRDDGRRSLPLARGVE